jgi:uncharacterized membrane protein
MFSKKIFSAVRQSRPVDCCQTKAAVPRRRLPHSEKIFFIAAALIFSFSLGFNVFAEQIDDFQTAIKINQDASINVTEKIFYDFGNNEQHGIYRDIPIKYQRNGLRYNLRISQIAVSDENGQPVQFTTSRSGDNLRIKIGDADTLLTGARLYVIACMIKRAINYFSDHDELYWNTTGNAWTVPINKASAEVELPTADKNKISSACYYGPYGSQQKCDSNLAGNMLSFSSANLNPEEGMTVVAGFPKNLVEEPTTLGRIIFFLEDNWLFGLPLIVLIVLFFVWRKYGRAPRDKHPVVAQYDVPDKLTPLEVGTLIDASADNKDLSAEIIYLAINGFIKIIRQDGVKIMGISTGADYLLQKLMNSNLTDNDFDRQLLDALIPDKEKRLSEIKKDTSSSQEFAKIKEAVYADLKTKGYFTLNPNLFRVIFSVIGSLFIAASVFGFFQQYGLSFGISLAASGIIFFLFAPFMAQETAKGVETKNYLKGLKLYLGVVEKDRLNFHNAPEKNPATFEKFLPYAMVLGVEKAWAAQFEGIYKEEPKWYVYPVGYNFVLADFSHDLNSFSSAANTSMAAAGHSGAVGGVGSSGSGFGGGGGGSW